jgi:hypothetical protein
MSQIHTGQKFLSVETSQDLKTPREGPLSGNILLPKLKLSLHQEPKKERAKEKGRGNGRKVKKEPQAKGKKTKNLRWSQVQKTEGNK